MAYMDQKQKAEIQTKLKTFVPKDWKWSLSVKNHTTLVMTVKEAPFNIAEAFKSSEYFNATAATNVTVSTQGALRNVQDPHVAQILQEIMQALNTGNYCNSDIHTDYFDVGHYVELRIGSWDKPFNSRAI